MLKKFSTKELVFIALIGTLLFLMELFIVAALGVIFGAGVGFLAVAVFWTAIAIFGGLVVRKFGTFTMMAFIYSVLAIPTTVFGPPGIYKIIPATLVGFLVDVSVSALRYRKAGYYLGAIVGQVVGLLLFAVAFLLLGFPGQAELFASLWFLIPLYAVEALLGCWIGILVNNKLKNKKILRQISY